MDHTNLPQTTSTIETHSEESHTEQATQNVGTNSSTTSTMSHNDTTAFDEKPAESTASDGVLQTTDGENNNKTEPKKPKDSVHSVSAVPNGGTQAWLQVLAAHFLFFNSWLATSSL
jgi:hypothetical protein